MRWWARGWLAATVAILLVACGATDRCVPGADCRWLLDTPHVGLWVGSDPFPAVVLRAELGSGSGLHLHLIWDRCTGLGCSWAPRVGPRPEPSALGADGVLALTRPAVAPDGVVELVRPLPDGTRLRLGALTHQRQLPAAPTSRDLDRCIGDLGMRLTMTTPAGAGTVLSDEIELVCRIWLHPGQGRTTMLWHPVLHRVARAHACDMAQRDYFGHVSPDGVGPNLRLAIAGYAVPEWYDQDVAGNNVESLALRAPTSSPTTTLDQWLASPMHRRHVLGESEFRAEQFDTATGYCSVVRDGVQMHFWAFVSARPAD